MCRMACAQVPRGAQAFVGERRRHADVDDRRVRAVRGGGAQELLGAADLGDDVEAVVGEQAPEPLADHDGVVGEDHAHGISARTRVPAPS